VDPRRAIIVLGGCLGLSLIVIAFLLGRESNRPVVVPVAPPTAPAPIVAPPPVAPPEPTGAAVPAIDPAEKAAVARYFRAVGALQNVEVGNPQAAATELVNSAASGDSSGLQKLVAQAREAERKAQAVTPPPPCAHYHKQLVAVLAESRAMMQQLERSVGGGNLDGLQALLGRANATKGRSEALAREERQIKSRYGIGP
jgi:hypothetical protein